MCGEKSWLNRVACGCVSYVSVAQQGKQKKIK